MRRCLRYERCDSYLLLFGGEKLGRALKPSLNALIKIFIGQESSMFDVIGFRGKNCLIEKVFFTSVITEFLLD